MKNKIIRKIAKLTPILLVPVFIGMQFVPTPGVSKTSTTRPNTAETINPRVGKILDRSCRDCHSNRTAWPWYSHVAPVSWVISKHVNEGREILNFSEWGAQLPSEGERILICDAVSDGRMPLSGYTAIHRNARLSKQDVEVICEWAAAPSASMTSTHVGKLTNNNK
jgi:Haem-binding domain